MPSPSEPPSRSFPPLDCPDRSVQPLADVLSTILIPLGHFGRIDLASAHDIMGNALTSNLNGYFLAFRTPEETFPLGYVLRTQLAGELLKGNRADVQALVTIAPCLPVPISLGEALRILRGKHAELGILCDLNGAAIGCCTSESLQCSLEGRI